MLNRSLGSLTLGFIRDIELLDDIIENRKQLIITFMCGTSLTYYFFSGEQIGMWVIRECLLIA